MFKAALESIIESTDGAIGALIMGTDGIAVEKVLLPEAIEANLDVAATELTSLVRAAQRAGRDTGLGGVRELTLALDAATVIMRLFSREYFVVVALKSEGNFGRGRYELRKAELQLAREFSL